jgi:predicted kinase
MADGHPGYAPVVPTRPRRVLVPSMPALLLALLLVVGCGGSDGDEQTPDEATFCRLAVVNEPIAEASASVLQRLDQLAPDEIDAAVVVLREAAEEIETHPAGSPEAVAAEFEVRFRPEYITARNELEAFVIAECTPEEELKERIDERSGSDATT